MMSETFKFNTIEEILDDLKAGKNIILIDDEDRCYLCGRIRHTGKH